MWYFILYVLIAIIGIAIVCRLSEDGIIDDISYDDLSDKEMAILFCCLWGLALPIFIIALVLRFIYKGIYYVVNEIYTKVTAKIRIHKTKIKNA